MIESKFYYKLVKAKNNNVELINVIDKIMPLINKYSKNNLGQVDEDLKNYLIEYIIKVIKIEGFAEKFLK